MDIEQIRIYCLSLPHVTEDTGLGEEYLLFRVMNKIFACYGFERDNYFVLKCNPDYAVDLRDKHPEITSAWHWNKKYWNQIDLHGTLSDRMIKSLINHSYGEVVKKLPKRTVSEHPELLSV